MPTCTTPSTWSSMARPGRSFHGRAAAPFRSASSGHPCGFRSETTSSLCSRSYCTSAPAPVIAAGAPIEYVDLITSEELAALEDQILPDEPDPQEAPPQDESAEASPIQPSAPPATGPGEVITSEGGETEIPAEAPEGR